LSLRDQRKLKILAAIGWGFKCHEKRCYFNWLREVIVPWTNGPTHQVFAELRGNGRRFPLRTKVPASASTAGQIKRDPALIFSDRGSPGRGSPVEVTRSKSGMSRSDAAPLAAMLERAVAVAYDDVMKNSTIHG
jgi:hypothetical protein